jgi:arginyl-tRNA synthetase
MNFFELSQSIISNALAALFPEKKFNTTVEISLTKDDKFGDFQSNVAFKIAKDVGLAPSVLAQKIVHHFDSNLPLTFSVAGAGFINITIKEKALLQAADHLPKFFSEKKHQGEKIIVEYSSPNVAKELHVGHLRSTIIGDALANCFESVGYDVLRLNHVGDWGTAFGMLIAYIKRHRLDYNNTNLSLSTLMEWYQQSKVEFDNSPEVYEDSKKEVVALQQGDPENLKIWQILCSISEQGYQKIYDALSIEGLHVRGESFYNPYLPKVIEDFKEKSLLTYSDGAACVFLEGFKNRENQPLPLIIQKADGGYNYATTDLASVRYRIFEDRALRIYYVTDNGQRDHFSMIFAAAEKVGYASKDQLIHVPFGIVQDEFKKRFKTRSGGVIKLQDLLDEAYQRAHSIATERHLSNPDHFAKVVGYGALKYADLSSNRIMDYVFDFDRMLAFEGNTIVYLLYSYVRASSILKKADHDENKFIYPQGSLNPSERRLLIQCLLYPHTVSSVLKYANPHLLCEYLYELATRFNHFFRDCPVLNAEEKSSRLSYVILFKSVLKQGLSLLGLNTIDEM